MTEKKATKSDKRFRNWSTIVYPDSENYNPEWLDILAEIGLKSAVSPLHNNDVNKDGTKKKAHYHVVFSFEGKVPKEQVIEVCKKIGAIEQPERLMSLRGSLRYLTHMDNPDKAQYKRSDVKIFGGLDYDETCMSDKDAERDITAQIGSILNYAAEKQITDFAELAEFLIYEKPELFPTYRKNAYFFSMLLKSKNNFTKKDLTNAI